MTLPTSVDLAELAAQVGERFQSRQLSGFIAGRTRVRDAVQDALGCSELVAEQLVDQMIGRDILHFHGNPTTPSATRDKWTLRVPDGP